MINTDSTNDYITDEILKQIIIQSAHIESLFGIKSKQLLIHPKNYDIVVNCLRRRMINDYLSPISADYATDKTTIYGIELIVITQTPENQVTVIAPINEII